MKVFCIPFYDDELFDNDKLVVVYNPAAVKRVVKENKKIFSSLNITLEMDPKEIVRIITNFEKGGEIIIAARGLLLGFDKNSSIKFARNEYTEKRSHSFNNIWGLGYRVADYNHPHYLKIKKKYEDLTKKVENLLEKGLSPTEVLHRLATDSDIHTIQSGIATRLWKGVRKSLGI